MSAHHHAAGFLAVLAARHIVTVHGQALEVARSALLGFDEDPWPSLSTGTIVPVSAASISCRAEAALILREAADRLDPPDV